MPGPFAARPPAPDTSREKAMGALRRDFGRVVLMCVLCAGLYSPAAGADPRSPCSRARPASAPRVSLAAPARITRLALVRRAGAVELQVVGTGALRPRIRRVGGRR